MKPYEWRTLLRNAVRHNDSTRLDSLVARLVESERAASILQHHGHGCTGQALDVVVCIALNVKAPNE
jgi:hypothetical protein